ncbi:uncharacterized protein LOC130902121 [Diorhabda carinulata]|uniref:uncharacterized protein LOC130902121 n=1 Tax=Diorhabda carinulata TaxID=1163345 RepID=UPI0025A0AFE9|nr:uncharacterized protein LOC130902121 [Diorhabda carinulata]
MNKLHNFTFVGEFPMFESRDNPGDEKINLQALSQEIYLPPIDYSKAYQELTENYKVPEKEKPSHNISTAASQKITEKCSNEIFMSCQNVDVDLKSIYGDDYIFFDSFALSVQSALPEEPIEPDIIKTKGRNPEKMKGKDNKSVNMRRNSPFLLENNRMMNLYYMNREKKVKHPRTKENKPDKRRSKLL